MNRQFDRAKGSIPPWGCLLAFLLPFAAMAADSTPPAPTAAEVLASAKTFSVDVDQSYTDAPGVSLPFREVAEFLLNAGGLTEVMNGPADAEVFISANGDALSKEYSDPTGTDQPQTCYSGAEMTGYFSVRGPRGSSKDDTFSDEFDPPATISKPYAHPADAPFSRVQEDFVVEFTKLAFRAFGIKVAEAVARLEDTDPLLARTPQLLPCALCEIARRQAPGALPQLLGALKSDNPDRVAAAARALRILGDSRAMPALVDCTVWAPDNCSADNNTMDDASSGEISSQENEKGELAPWPEILSALCSLYTPAYADDLIRALGDLTLGENGRARRISAAIVLGGKRVAAAVMPLLAAANSDDNLDNDAVGAAAVYALGEIHDQVAVPRLRELARSTTVGGQTQEAISYVLQNSFGIAAP